MSEALGKITRKERALQAELRRYKRQVLGELLELLTPSQLDNFKRVYGTVNADRVPMGEIIGAIGLVDRTVEKNKDRVLDVIAERH
jgi:hypothetical protein